MTIHTFLSRRSRFANTLSVLLALLMLLPSLAGFAKPMQSAAASPSGDPVDRLKVGDVIWAKSNATGKAEWKQIIHSSKRTVPALLNVRLINAKTGKTAAELTCPLDEKVTLNNGKRIPAARLAVGNSIITRAGPVCRISAMWLLKRPGGFVLSDVRVGPLSASQAQRLAASQSTPARPQKALSYADYAAPASAGGGTLNPFLFQGQQFDPASGDYYLRARYYDPMMGRFLSRDPLPGRDDEPYTQNAYIYANDDPVNAVDPSGQGAEGLGGTLATLGSIAGLTALTTSAILLNPAPANAPGPNDRIYADHSGQDTLVFIAEGEGIGRGITFVGTRYLAPVAKAVLGRVFRSGAQPTLEFLREGIQIRQALGIGQGRNIAIAHFNIGGDTGHLVSVSGEASRVGTIDLPAPTKFETFPTPDAPNNPRAFDSERKLLETISNGMKDPNAGGYIQLFSEREVCGSCQGVIDQFKALHPNVRIEVIKGY